MLVTNPALPVPTVTATHKPSRNERRNKKKKNKKKKPTTMGLTELSQKQCEDGIGCECEQMLSSNSRTGTIAQRARRNDNNKHHTNHEDDDKAMNEAIKINIARECPNLPNEVAIQALDGKGTGY